MPQDARSISVRSRRCYTTPRDTILVEGLGGAQKILDVNYYKHCHASLCLVLPPVGSARSAILLLECIELCVLKTRFGNSGDEGRRGRVQIRCGPRAGWRDGSERPC